MQKKITIDTEPLVRFIKENPLSSITAAAASFAAFTSGAAKLSNARTAKRNSKTYAKEIARRTRSKK